MSAFAFRLATPADDAALRRLARDIAMPGTVTLAYEREPAFFLGDGPLGDAVQTLVACEPEGGEIVAVASRAVRRVFVGGEEQRTGYLSGLRVHPRWRGRHLVASGFAALRRLHDADPVGFSFAAITAGNRDARGVLAEKPRGAIPAFRPLTDVGTLALVVRRGGRPARSPYEIEGGSEAMWPDTVAFLREHGRHHDFFPSLAPSDLGTPLLRGLAASDFLLARRAGALVGVAALWDQRGYKQTVVRAYGGALRWARPLVSTVARRAGFAPLPAPGEALRSAYAAFFCTPGDDPTLVRALLGALLGRAAERGLALVLVGLAASDPRLVEVRRRPHIPYASTLYTVAWDDAPDLAADGRRAHVEIATL